ncbi:MAG: hypothetical protein NTY96_08620 [Bacteroidetes bacterium]|nr:hypothetical protein [Bacteroidota bacterium]
MKQKIFIISGLILLVAVIAIMLADLFSSKKADQANPYDYKLGELKKTDSSLNAYSEQLIIKPELEEIHAIACGPGDRIYVAGKNGLEVYNMDGKPDGNFRFEGVASCLALDKKGDIFIGIQEHVEVFDQIGRPLKKWKSISGESVLTGIAVSDSFVFLADAGKKIVYRYDHSGRLINRIGEKDPQKNIPGFIVPSPYFDLALGTKGELWVANTGRHSLEQFSNDGSLNSAWGEASMAVDGFCGCCNPSHFAFLSDGSFVTSEKGIERVKVFSPQGVFKCIVAPPSAFIEGTRGLDLAVDSEDRIIVLDPEKNLVRIFVKK